MPLLVTSHKTPVGTLNLLADDQILIGANLSTVSAFKAGRDVKVVKSIPVISDLISDYFDGDLTALNGIQVRQPGAAFSQAAWKAMRKVAPGKTWSYADLAAKAGSPAAVRAAGSACANSRPSSTTSAATPNATTDVNSEARRNEPFMATSRSGSSRSSSA